MRQAAGRRQHLAALAGKFTSEKSPTPVGAGDFSVYAGLKAVHKVRWQEKLDGIRLEPQKSFSQIFTR